MGSRVGFNSYLPGWIPVSWLAKKNGPSRDFLCRARHSRLRDLRKWQFREHSTVGIFLESGTLEIIYGNKKKGFRANEAVYFDAGVPHKTKNINSIEAKLFILTSPALD